MKAERPVRIYVSGQMRGLEDHGKTRFDMAENYLTGLGHEVYVPGRGCSETVDLRTVFLIDMTVILGWADAVVLVERQVYRKSKGVLAEMTTALAAGVQVWQPSYGPEGGLLDQIEGGLLDQIEGTYRRIKGISSDEAAKVIEGMSQTLTVDAFNDTMLYA